MYCLKCGKETQEEQVFCAHCLEIMEQYPIKPGTPVQLPRKESAPAPKKSGHRLHFSQDDLVRQLRVTVRVLTGCLLAALLLLGYFVWQSLRPEEPGATQKEPGQNYTVDITGDKGE